MGAVCTGDGGRDTQIGDHVHRSTLYVYIGMYVYIVHTPAQYKMKHTINVKKLQVINLLNNRWMDFSVQCTYVKR